ncbi:distal membrane-arm assembly complex protein 2 [Leucoraja erinacea]|uniref:distal membrane-arm assembly complex protein 2 n=1 Tax=Leucoraja erinaceus TaxID=7782 RepID=UPI0024570DD9|nr:distal membrane-arm assembly complex protein 2 [Leucoraja erinacea]
MATALGHWLQLTSRRTMRGYQVLAPLRCPARPSSSQPKLVHWTQRGLLKLYQRFYDVENLFNWSIALRNWNLRRKNAYYGYTQKTYGIYIAAAYYILSQRGAVRFAGEEEWIRPNKRGKFSYDFLSLREVPLEAVDASGTSITYDGLDNLVCLKELKYLRLNNCPHVDDWCLSRLHVFGDSLEELGLAGCPKVTERGLASLHHLKNLRRLDLSDLPSVDNRGLLRILLEETLPQCVVVGIKYEDGLLQQPLTGHSGSSPQGMGLGLALPAGTLKDLT